MSGRGQVKHIIIFASLSWKRCCISINGEGNFLWFDNVVMKGWGFFQEKTVRKEVNHIYKCVCFYALDGMRDRKRKFLSCECLFEYFWGGS